MEAAPLLEKQIFKLKEEGFIWYPFTQALIDPPPKRVVSAENASLKLSDGSSIIDAISSWWVTLHGHRHPVITEAIQKQLNTLDHVMLAGYTHAPAENVAEELVQLLGTSYGKVFFSDNGSTAVETALKASLQAHYNKGHHQKKTILAFKDGYHGDTFGAMSVTQRGLFSKPFDPFLFDVSMIAPPSFQYPEQSLEELKKKLESNDVATFIFEPMIQAVAGMKKHCLKTLDQMIKMCKEYSVTTIADEVMTGMGRVGSYFVTDHLENKPDIVCLSKSLTGGFLPLGATVFRKGFFENFLSLELSKAFLHGHTYCGNPLACSAALASLKLLQSSECHKQRDFIEKSHQDFLAAVKHYPAVASAYVSKTLLFFEYKTKEASSYHNPVRNKLYEHFQKHRVLIRPFGNTFHVLPPYCITESELAQIYKSIETVLKKEF